MGWEKRGNGHYYYRKYRTGRRVSSEYVGKGEAAEYAEMIDANSRATQGIEKQKNRQLLKTINGLRVLNNKILPSEQLVSSIFHYSLLSAGYHTHHRQWRKKRCPKIQATQNS